MIPAKADLRMRVGVHVVSFSSTTLRISPSLMKYGDRRTDFSSRSGPFEDLGGDIENVGESP